MPLHLAKEYVASFNEHGRIVWLKNRNSGVPGRRSVNTR